MSTGTSAGARSPHGSALVVFVEFRARPGQAEAFAAMVEDNAARSVALEPGCRRFDVLRDPDDPDALLLYEIYEDRAAFDAHLASDHFRSFDSASAALVATKAVRLFQLKENAKP